MSVDHSKMSAFTIYCFLGALLCSQVFAFSQSEKERMAEEVAAIERNAKFQKNLALVATSTQVYGAEEVELSKATSKEQKSCIKVSVKVAVEEGHGIVEETVGKIIPEVAAVSRIAADEASSDQDWQTVADFLSTVDYPAYKKTSMVALKDRLVSWIPEKQTEMAKCLA